MIENLILIGIGIALGVVLTLGAIYIIARMKLDAAISKLDEAQRRLDSLPPIPSPEQILRMVEDLEDDDEIKIGGTD